MKPTHRFSGRRRPIFVGLLAALVAGQAAASASTPREFDYTNVLTVTGVDPEHARLQARDAGEVPVTIATDDTTRVQDALGAEIALADLEPWDRVAVDARPKGGHEGQPLVADRIQLVIGTPGAYRSDEDRQRRDAALRERIVERLAASRTLQGSDVWVTVSDGQVGLYGLVADEAAEQRAVEIARRTPAARGVSDHLRTDPSLLEWVAIQREDDVLAREVAERLVAEVFPGSDARLEEDWIFGWEIDADAFELDVDADMGTVTLTGSVPEREDAERAIAVTRRTPGVRNVRTVLTYD